MPLDRDGVVGDFAFFPHFGENPWLTANLVSRLVYGMAYYRRGSLGLERLRGGAKQDFHPSKECLVASSPYSTVGLDSLQ